MKHLPLTCLTALLALSASAQTPLLKPADFSASSGMSVFSGGTSEFIDGYHKNFPNSSILSGNYSTYNSSTGYMSHGTTTGIITMGFNLRNKEKTGYYPNRLFRIGLTFGSSSSFANNFYKQESFPYDTLRSSNGTIYPIDSTSSQNLSMSVESKNILVDAALIFRTSSSKRWKLFAGIGVQAGAHFNGQAIVNQSNSSYLTLAQGGYMPFNNEVSSNWKTESISVKPGFYGAAYIPMGIDWQTGKTKPFFKQLHLFYELRPTLGIIQQNGFGTEIKTGANQQLGIRIQFMD